jgi:hypothetical protein
MSISSPTDAAACAIDLGSPSGDPAGLTFQNAVFVAALSDDQGHHVSLFWKGSPELTPVTQKQRTAGGVDGETLASGEQHMRKL